MNFNKVYVLCPIGIKTGGPELLRDCKMFCVRMNDSLKLFL